MSDKLFGKEATDYLDCTIENEDLVLLAYTTLRNFNIEKYKKQICWD